MPPKDAKTKARDDSKPDKVYAGGNPDFDERKPKGSNKTAKTVHAGVNPDFDERQTGRAKSL